MTTPTMLSSPLRPTTTTTTTLLSLPDEVLALIVESISDSCLLKVARVCKNLNWICSSPLEMRRRCVRMRWWEERHDMDRKKALPRVVDVNWRELFMYRMRVGRVTAHHLGEIMAHPTQRTKYFNLIAEYGYDAKDCLQANTEIGDDEVKNQARSVIRYIHSCRALAIWHRVIRHNDVPLEMALLGLDLFAIPSCSPDVENISRNLDNMAAAFLASTAAAGLDFAGLDVEGKSVKLITWMWDQGLQAVPTGQYQTFNNVFISPVIHTMCPAVPLIIVAIFCALARRLGLVVHQCEYPGHILAIVEDEDGHFQYYDPTSRPYPRQDRARLAAELSMGESDTALMLSPVSVADLVFLSVRDIIKTLPMSKSDTLRVLRAEEAATNSGYMLVRMKWAMHAAGIAIEFLGRTFVDQDEDTTGAVSP